MKILNSCRLQISTYEFRHLGFRRYSHCQTRKTTANTTDAAATTAAAAVVTTADGVNDNEDNDDDKLSGLQ